VTNTKAATLKEVLSSVLSTNAFDVQNLRGQGYDGASNMRGEFNGLQALFLRECPYAYYVHCYAHRLQLALVSASKEVIPWLSFSRNFYLSLTLLTLPRSAMMSFMMLSWMN
jgi:hypothetical protein